MEMDITLEESVESRLANEVFHNPLIADEIWKRLNVQEMLRVSLVCKQFCSLSRKFLRISQYCSIQLDQNPCRALQKVNKLLETSTDVCFNGIHHKRKVIYDDDWNKWYLPYKCDDSCLSNHLGDFVDVRQLYSNILNKMEFRFVSFRPRLNKNCPFLKFIEIVLTVKANEITELRACGRTLNWERIPNEPHRDICNVIPFRQPLWFPNLKILKVPENINISIKLILSAPKLTKVLGFIDGETFKTVGMDCKEFLITDAQIVGMEEILRLTTTIKPKLEKVSLLLPPCKREEYHYAKIHINIFSHMIYKSLRRLQCSISMLTLLANGAGMTHFRSLKSILLYNDWEHKSFQKAANCLKSVEFKSSFPSVEIVRFLGNDRIGPIIRTIFPPKQDFQSLSVTSLTLNFRLFKKMPIVSNIFPNVTNLTMFDLTCDANLPKLFTSNPEWIGLETLNLWGCIQDLQLDNLFNYLGKKFLPDDRGSHDNTNSFVPSVKLKTLVIVNHCVCFRPTCDLQENLDRYLISEDVAKLIATKLPGFTIQVRMYKSYEYLNNSEFEPVGYIFDHIRPYARIWKTSLDGTEEDGIETLNIWNLEFQTLNNL